MSNEASGRRIMPVIVDVDPNRFVWPFSSSTRAIHSMMEEKDEDSTVVCPGQRLLGGPPFSCVEALSTLCIKPVTLHMLSSKVDYTVGVINWFDFLIGLVFKNHAATRIFIRGTLLLMLDSYINLMYLSLDIPPPSDALCVISMQYSPWNECSSRIDTFRRIAFILSPFPTSI